MTQIVQHRYALTVHPLQAVFLAGVLPWFLGTLLADLAYMKTFHIQWNNFASWLLVGGLVFNAVALVLAIIDLCRPRTRTGGTVMYTLVLLAMWIVGFFNALMHARDAWASMPAGMVMSVTTVVLACLANWLGFRTPHIRGAV